jgi:nucleotide-binding universal stress UspA family protein
MFRKIVVPLDTSPLSEQAAWKAAAIARVTHATVHLVHVYEPRRAAFDAGAIVDEQLLALDRAQFERHLLHTAGDLTRRFGCKCQVAMLTGAPPESIMRYARQQGADLIVMSTHGRTGASRAWFGSVSDTLAREAALPVLLVRPDDAMPKQLTAGDPPFSRILIALDGSDSAETILSCVHAMKSSEHAEHLLVEVVNPVPLPLVDYRDAGMVAVMAPDVEATEALVEQAKEYLGAVAHRLDREGVAKVAKKVILAASTGPAIVDEATLFRADLVAMTSHGRGASRLLVGSVADKILRGTHSSILLRRTPVAKSAAPRRRANVKRLPASKGSSA